MYKKITKIANKYSWLLIFIVFVLVNIFFNYNLFWHQLIFDNSQIGAVWGEVRVYEWLTDKFYRILVAGGNPFGLVDGMLYPFKIQLGLTDAANGFFYVPLRPFFSPFQSFSIIIAVSQIMATIGMYGLLRKLYIQKSVSCIIALAFGYMTFLAPREGHLNYWVIYVFPWIYFSIIHFITQKSFIRKVIAGLGITLFFTLALWLNFYYFIMLAVSIGVSLIYFFLWERKKTLLFIYSSWREILIICCFGIILLSPWLAALYDIYLFDEVQKISGWGGAIQFSSDLFSFFVPSGYNHYIYNYFSEPYISIVQKLTPFAYGAFENFTYPGIIIIASFAGLLLIWRRKNFHKHKKVLIPFLILSCVFFILTLGPFLHVFGKWGLTVDPSIRIVIPLPYVLFHYIPLLENIRVPGRLIVAFIFFANIVSAYVISYFLTKRSSRFIATFLVTMFIVFIFDHRYVSNLNPPPTRFPYKIFDYIKKDFSPVTVLELPFVVRDGFTYFGDESAILSIVGESYHHKPVLGGYTGRIADYKRIYYYHNPLFGYLGRSIDENVEINPIIDKSELSQWQKIDQKAAFEVLDFLDVKYIITDNSKKTIATASSQLKKLGFKETMKDDSFSLLVREPKQREFLNIDLRDKNAVTYLGMGWGPIENNGRLAGRKFSFMFKLLRKRKMKLIIEGQVSSESKATVYLNKKKLSSLKIQPAQKIYVLDTDDGLKTGINTIHIMLNSYSQEKRNKESDRFVTFTKINLEEK